MTAALALDGADALTHAIAYAHLGWRVVPILPGAKRPAIDRWTERATTDPELIAQWWATNPTHGVGIATGPHSGIFALDVDPAHGGGDTLADLESLHGQLPATVEAITGGGGRHLLFWWPSNLPADRKLGNSAGRLGPGLDIRGDGGQIVVAPTMHPTSGRRYEWELSSRPGEVEVAEAPYWLLSLLLEDHHTLPEGQLDTHRYDHRFAWDAYNALGNSQAVALLQAHGWHSPRTDRAGVTYLTRPGKAGGDGSGVSVGKVAPGVVYCFTSEAPPLQAERGYRPADLFAELYHQGDRRAADEALCAQSGLAPTYATDPAVLSVWVAGEHARAVALGLAVADCNGNGNGNGNGEVREARAFLDEPEEPYDWLVEGLIERGDRLILTGPEGGGKSTLLRQMAVQIASGIHPFDESATFAGANVLIVDCENSPRHIKRKLRGLVEVAGKRLERDRLWIVPKPEGIDLGSRVDLEWLLAIAEQVRPELLIIGPIYKMSDGDPIEEQTAKVVIRAIDLIRARHDCAVLIEAHTPHESKTERPYGASIWKRWPEFGLYLDRMGPLRHWRGARDERQWPSSLARGRGPMAWPWEAATDRAVTFMKMVEVQRSAAKVMSVREIADALTAQGIGTLGPVSKSTVQRAIDANRGAWDLLLEELGFGEVSE